MAVTSSPGQGAAETRQPSDSKSGGEALRHLLELLAVSGFAISQPVLDAFGNAPEHFVFRGISRGEIVAFAVLVALVPPVVLTALELVVSSVRPKAGRVVHVGAIGILAVLGAVQLGWRVLDLRSSLLVIFALVIGGAIVALHLRFDSVRLWLRYAAVLPVLAVASFVLASPVSDLIFPPDVEAAAIDAASTPPIVMLIFDELPTATLIGKDGEIDADLYPNFARLADDAAWYRNNTTNNNYTTWAVPGLLSGLQPVQERTPTLASYPENLFTLLGETYVIRADEAPIAMCPASICGDQPTSAGTGGLRQLLDDAVSLWQSQVDVREPGSGVFALVEETGETETEDEPRANEVLMAEGIAEFRRLVNTSPLRFSEFLAAIEPSPEPTLNYLHIQVPHDPWRFYANGAEYTHTPEMPGIGADLLWAEREAATRTGRQRHILQTQYADRLVGDLIDHLHARDLYHSSYVVIASDHGIAFSPGSARRGDTETLTTADYADVFWSLLMIKDTDQPEGETSDVPTELKDVLPTIAARLGVDPGWGWDGAAIPALSGDDLERAICRQVRTGSLATEEVCEEVDDDLIYATMLERGAGAFAPNVGSELRVHQVGPYSDLVGTHVEALAIGPPADQRLVLQALGDFANVRGTKVPGLIRGGLSSTEEGVVIAFALNGTIAAVTASWSTDGEAGGVSAILPVSLFSPGGNDLTAHVVDGGPSDPVLREIAVDFD